jgi:hypothetical protein
MKKVDELLSKLTEADVPKTEKLDGKAPLGDKPKANTEGDAEQYAKEKKLRELGKMTEIDDLLEKLSQEIMIGDNPKEAGQTNPEGNDEKKLRDLGQMKEA